MKTVWDYSDLARHYVHRPDYAPNAIKKLFSLTGLIQKARICDVGAGVGHLAIPMLQAGHWVTAVEPNDAMRALGKERTSHYTTIQWIEGTAEDTRQKEKEFDLVTFGSSFNVCDREKALKESARILKDAGWFFCTWNHRDLEDSLQKDVEDIIKKNLGSYDYGSRREEQSEIINQSGLFEDLQYFEEGVTHEVSKEIWIDAWRSHATLSRQAEEKTDHIAEIDRYIKGRNIEVVRVPYVTRCWLARKK